MDSERRIFPRRYLENSRQPPRLIGLSADEALEFERLDRRPPSIISGIEQSKDTEAETVAGTLSKI